MWLFPKRKKIIEEKGSILEELWTCSFKDIRKNRFELENTESMKSEIRSDKLCLTAKKQNLFVWSLNEEYRYKNFVLDAVCSIDKDNGHSAAGVLFRYANESNYYYFLISENGYFRLDVIFNGSPRILIPWTLCKLDTADKIGIRLIVRGESITLYLNEDWLGEIDDDSIDAGFTAFGGQNFSNKDTANFSLSEITIESRSVEVESIYQSQAKQGIVPLESRLEFAKRLFEQGQYSAVLVQIKKALKVYPENYNLSLLMAMSLSRIGLYDEALKALESCSGTINQDIIVEKAGILYKKNSLIELKNFLNSNISFLKSNAFLLNLMGNTLDALGDFSGSVDYYRKSCDLEPDNAVFQLNIARSLEKMSEIKSAFSHYYEAALCFFREENYEDLFKVILGMDRLFPASQEARILEGKVLFHEKKTEEAFKIFKKLKEENLQDSSVDFLYGIILREKGNSDAALQLFKKSAEEAVEYYPYWFKYAETLYLMGLPAKEEALTAIKLEENNAWAHNLYGLILLSENKYSEAKKSFAIACELDKDSVDILINYSDAVAAVDGIEKALFLLTGKTGLASVQNQMGNLFYANGNYSEATDSYRRAVSISPENTVYRENLASSLIKQDYILAAEEILSELISEKSSASVLEMIAQVAFRKGEYRRADISFVEAIKLEPDNFRILLNYGDFLYTRLKYKEAGDIAERIISIAANSKISKSIIETANLLMQKVDAALNDRYECDSCGHEWIVPKNIPVIDVVRIHGEPDGESPAGKCKKCGNVYCVKCSMDHIRDKRFVCPDCDEYLKLSENYLKYLAMKYAEE